MKKTTVFFIMLIAVLTAAKGQVFRTALATPQISGGFVVGVTVTDGGSGYTNMPPVHILGGGGTNASMTATISGGAVTGIVVNNTGSNYTSVPIISIAPPFVPLPLMSAAPAAQLVFSNMNQAGGQYEFQQLVSNVWLNQNYIFVDSLPTHTTFNYTVNMADVGNGDAYRLISWPVPEQATAVAQVTNGFVTGITITDPGTGYQIPTGGIDTPTIQIVGGGGSGAQATATVNPVSTGSGEGLQFNYEVVSITINNPGSGYTGVPNVVIDTPPAMQILPPSRVTPLVFVGMENLVTNLTYQLQSSVNLNLWSNTSPAFMAATVTNSLYLSATNSQGFFRLQYIP